MEWNPQTDQATAQLWLRLARSGKAFLTFDTKTLVDVSEWRNAETRAGLTASLFVMAVTVMVFASSRFYPGSEGSSDFIGWSAGSAVAFAAVLIVPALIGYKVLKLPRLGFTLNVVLLQQSLLAVGAICSSLILMSQEPARTDFSLLREGKAEGTLAYRRFCGDLEAAARLHALGGRTMQRTESVQRDIDETDSWGDPNKASIQQAFSHLPRMRAQMRHREKELKASLADLQQSKALIAERESIFAAFDEKYPTYAMAQQFFAAWFLIIVSLALIHLWRGLVLGDRGERSKISLVAGAVLSSAIAIAFTWWISVTGELASYREILLSPPSLDLLEKDIQPSTYEELRREAQKYRAEFSRLQRDHQRERDELRGQFYRLRGSCPHLNAAVI